MVTERERQVVELEGCHRCEALLRRVAELEALLGQAAELESALERAAGDVAELESECSRLGAEGIRLRAWLVFLADAGSKLVAVALEGDAAPERNGSGGWGPVEIPKGGLE